MAVSPAFQTSAPASSLLRVTPEYFAGWFDNAGSILCIHRNARNPQIRASVPEMGDGIVLRQAQRTLGGIGNLNPIAGRKSWRWLIYNRDELYTFVRWIKPYVLLKREILDKSEEVLNQLAYLAMLREKRPAAPLWDDALEKEYAASLLELYDLVAEHDEIRTRKDD